MHSTLSELLENLKTGLLWVTRDGVVRYANADAANRTGLAPGRKLFDPDLLRSVTEVVAHSVPRLTKTVGVAAQPGGALPELSCRVLPGLARDDAFVLIGNDGQSDAGTAYDNPRQVIRPAGTPGGMPAGTGSAGSFRLLEKKSRFSRGWPSISTRQKEGALSWPFTAPETE